MDLTIVIPIYNRKKFIKPAIDSIVNSGVDIKQLIIIDNNSNDGSYEYVNTIKGQYSLDIHLDRETKQGAAAARNKGLQLCKTEWVFFFDSDDEFTGLPSEWNKNMDMVCFPTQMIMGNRLVTRSYSAVSAPHYQILNCMLNTLSMIFKTKYLRHIGGWQEECRIWDDWELGIRSLANTDKVQWLTSKAYHRIFLHPDSISGDNFSDKKDELIHTLEIAFDDIYAMPEGKEKNKCLFAFFLRCYILSGEFLKEGNPYASRDIHVFINKYYEVSRQDYKMGHLIEWYVSKGLRGAWKIALFVVNRL